MHLSIFLASLIALSFISLCDSQDSSRNRNRDFTEIVLCQDGPDSNLTSPDPYCTCKRDVISCDFSPLQTSSAYEIVFSRGAQDLSFESDKNVKRMCFCGGPNNLHVFLNNDIPYRFQQLHRVDFYNIPGRLHLRKAFVNYFSGDIYMDGVRVNTIHTGEFGRGNTFTIEDTSEIKCCSKIETNKKLTRPVLHIENSILGLINSSGINSYHMWSTVIMKNVTVHQIEENGISLDNHGLNVSFVDCKFESSNATSINLNYAANLFMARNSFSNKCHPLSFGSVSTHRKSNVILLENYFNNSMVIKLDAEKVLLWLNHFDRWDNDTFIFLNDTSHKDRIFAVINNVVEDITDLTPKDIPRKAGLSGKLLILQSNVLGYCDCSSQKQLSPALTSSKCQTQASKSSKTACYLEIRETPENCRNEGVCISGREDYVQQLIDFLHKNSLSLDSSFISDQLTTHPIHYKLTGIASHVPGPIEYNVGISYFKHWNHGMWSFIAVVLSVAWPQLPVLQNLLVSANT